MVLTERTRLIHASIKGPAAAAATVGAPAAARAATRVAAAATSTQFCTSATAKAAVRSNGVTGRVSANSTGKEGLCNSTRVANSRTVAAESSTCSHIVIAADYPSTASVGSPGALVVHVMSHRLTRSLQATVTALGERIAGIVTPTTNVPPPPPPGWCP
jgi:hypothetical protein